MSDNIKSTVVHGGALIPDSETNVTQLGRPGAQSSYWDRQVTSSSQSESDQAGPLRSQKRDA